MAVAIGRILEKSKGRWSHFNHTMLLTSACCSRWSRARLRLIDDATAAKAKVQTMMEFVSDADKKLKHISAWMDRQQPKFNDTQQKQIYEEEKNQILRSVGKLRRSLKESGGEDTLSQLYMDKNRSIEAWTMWERFG